MARVSNLFAEVPDELEAEQTELILDEPGVRIERIISMGHASPDGFWYDQDEDEWVLLLSGEARLRFEEEPEARSMVAGDYLFIPAHRRHRVDWTSDSEPTLWLAVFQKPQT